MASQLSKKAALPLAKILATCRNNVSNTGPRVLMSPRHQQPCNSLCGSSVQFITFIILHSYAKIWAWICIYNDCMVHAVLDGIVNDDSFADDCISNSTFLKGNRWVFLELLTILFTRLTVFKGDMNFCNYSLQSLKPALPNPVMKYVIHITSMLHLYMRICSRNMKYSGTCL